MKYTIQPNDSLSKIALKFYGSANRYQEIVNANPQITNPDLIRVGDVIDIPNTTSIPSAPQNDATTYKSDSGVSQYIPYVAAAVLIAFAVSAATKRREV